MASTLGLGIDKDSRRARVLIQISAGDRQIISYDLQVQDRSHAGQSERPLTDVPTYHLRTAQETDVEPVLALRRHAEQWLRDAGIEQRTKSEYGARVIKGWIGAGSTFVVHTDDGEIIGSLSLDTGDPDFWTPEELSEPALYLYKFILRSDHRGNGLGGVLLDWASYRTELVGDLYLRLDCWRDNTGMHNYYLRRGFHYIDTGPYPVRMSGALFERSAELRLAQSAAVRLIDENLGHQFHPVPGVPLSQ